MTKLELIRVERLYHKVKQLIQKGWTKGCWAKDKDGNATSSEDPTACSWCLLGAIHRAETELCIEHPLAGILTNELRILTVKKTGFLDLAYFNDRIETTQADVLRMLDLAIAEVKSKYKLRLELT